VLLDQSNSPVRYEPVLTPTWPSSYLQPPTVTTARGAHQHVQVWESSAQLAVFAQAVAVFICEVLIPSSHTGAEKLVLGEFVTATSHDKAQQSERAEAARSESPNAVNAILQMRPARRSLEDKARKELSAFDREYPW
jgi:hypothetical protein